MAENAEPKPTAGETSAPKSDLPHVESPSISPDEQAGKKTTERLIPLTESAPAIFVAPTAKPAFKLRPRHRRAALLAASLTFAAAFGSMVGAVTTQHFAAAAKPPTDTAALDERNAMQQSIAHLSQQVATLKLNLDVATRTAHREIEGAHREIASAHSEVSKIAERLAAAASEVTGSVTPPQTAPAAAPAPALEQQAATPLPPPRPAPEQVAAAPPPRTAVAVGWSLRSARDGVALVETRGEVFEAVLGAPLPGLGPVQAIKREDGRWMVVTPRGIIVSARDRHYFD